MQLADLSGKRLGGLDGFGQGEHGCGSFLAAFEIAVDNAHPVATGKAGAVDAQLCWVEHFDRPGQEAFDPAGLRCIGGQQLDEVVVAWCMGDPFVMLGEVLASQWTETDVGWRGLLAFGGGRQVLGGLGLRWRRR